MNTQDIIALSDDDKAISLKQLKDTMFAVRELHDWISKDSLTENMKETVSSLIEHNIADLSKVLKFDSLSADKMDKRYTEIKNANQKIQELEKQIGRNSPIEGLSEQLKVLSDSFNDWWRSDGFGYVRESKFTEFGRFEAVLGFSFSRSSVFSKSPATDRQEKQEWLDGLETKGYKIHKTEDRNDKELIDCPENRKLLTELLQKQFPSVQIDEFRSRMIYNADGSLFELFQMKIEIKNLTELKNLED